SAENRRSAMITTEQARACSVHAPADARRQLTDEKMRPAAPRSSARPERGSGSQSERVAPTGFAPPQRGLSRPNIGSLCAVRPLWRRGGGALSALPLVGT